MLQRIIIKNIGRFVGCTVNGEREFREKTVIYGSNGNGKSTITAILRSLSTGNNNLLIGRKSFGRTEGKEVVLHFDDGTYCNFKNKRWQCPPCTDFLIFDDKFIADNIFDAGGVADEHKANMHRAIVGNEGKKLVEPVHEIESEISKKKGEKHTLESGYAMIGFDQYVSLVDFFEIKEDPEIAEKIETKEKELEFASQLEKPQHLTFRGHDFPGARDILSRDFTTLHKQAVGAILDHVKRSTTGEIRDYNFLQIGFSIHEKCGRGLCPLCGQDTSAVEQLFGAYSAYFDENYKTHQQEVRGLARRVQQWNVENELTELVAESNEWGHYFVDKTPLDVFSEEVNTLTPRVKKAKEALEKMCREKIEDPTYRVDLSCVGTLHDAWAAIGKAVEVFNDHIAAFVAQIGTKKTGEIKRELEILKIHKARYKTRWKIFFEKYETLFSDIKKLKINRTKALTALSEYSRQVFEDHQKNINTVLEDIGADFRVANLSEQKDLRKTQAVYCGFDLRFFGAHNVSLNGGETEATFTNTLSNGDRSALAFAFFVSMVQNCPDLENKIVVFDDPISSFDKDRRRATIHILSQLSNTIPN